jgi:hypothetical protein
MIPTSISEEEIGTLKVGTAPTEVTVVDGPFLRKSIRGYYPVLKVKVKKSGIVYFLAIGSRSLTDYLDPLYKRDKKFTGLELSLSKKTDAEMSPYVVEEIRKV